MISNMHGLVSRRHPRPPVKKNGQAMVAILVLGCADMPSARQESNRFLVPLYFVEVLLFVAMIHWPASRWATIPLLVLAVALTFFVSYFFRDPERELPADLAIIVSAADGLVVSVDEMDEPDFQLGRMRRIAVFLSVFDVHVNRSPVRGRVKKTVYNAGKFLDARHLDAATLNEARAWWLESESGPVAVRQIAGLIARRIVAWSREGALLNRGERLGMIRFGSRTEVFVPLDCTVLVKPGDRVQGASTPLARWPA
jgi:phosphatidylserine decarboxylase